MTTTTIHGQLYEVFSPTEISAHLFTLGKTILSSGEKFDRVVALARGGVSIAQTLADIVGTKMISTLQCESYEATGKTKKPIITQPFTIDITGEHILLIDDLADSGETLVFATQFLLDRHATSVKTATFLAKPWATLRPDFYAITSKAWIIFPWETRETIISLTGIWGKKGDSLEEIAKNLKQLGFTQDQIETFAQS